MTEREKTAVETSDPLSSPQDSGPSDRRRSLRRWISVGAGVIGAAVVAVVVMSGAEQANGSEKVTEEDVDKAPVPVEVVVAREGSIASYVGSR